MHRSIPRLLISLTALAALLTAAPAAAATRTWASAVSGNWSNGANWVGGLAPAAGDDVVIDVNGDYTVTVDVNASPNSLTVGAASGVQTLAISSPVTLTVASASTFGPTTVVSFSAGTITGNGTISSSGTFNWSGGTLTAASSGLRFTINSGAALNISGAGKNFTQRTIDNSGTTTWSGTGAINSGLGATFNNLAGAVFEIQGDASLVHNQGGAIPLFNNSGTLRKTGGTGTTTFGSTFNQNSSVAVEVASGTLALNNGGSHGGGFTIGSGAVLRFGGGTHTLTATSGLSGAGSAEFTAGSVTVSGNYALSTNPVFSAASVVFNGTISAFGSSMAVPSGTVTFNTSPTAALQTVSVSGTGTVTFSGGTPLALASITLSGGTLGGTDSFSVSSSFNWSGGTLTAPSTTPTLTINSGAALDISGAVAKFFTLRRIDNSGTTTWSGTGAVNAGGGATFNNLAGGTFEIGGDASWLYNQGGAIPVVNNSGTLRKTAGPGVTTFGSIFNQSSSTPVEVSSGALALNNGGNHSGGFTIGSGAILRFGGGTHTLAATSGLSGAGAAEFTGGSVTVSGSYALSTNPVFSAASVVFNGTISAFGSSMAVPSGTVTFNTSPTAALQTVSVSGTGTVTFSGGTPLALASITLSGGTLGGTDSFSVSSSFNWSGGTLTAPSTTPTLTINSGAALDISGAVAKFFTLRRIDNSGTTTWSGTGAVNAGGGATFNNLAGGTFEIGGDASWLYNQGGAIPVVNNSGTLRKTAGPGVTTFGSIFNQSSSTPVEVSSGALALNNGGNHSGGFTIGSGAILRFGGGTHTLAATSGLSGAGAAEFTGGSVTVSGNYALSTNPVFSAASVVFNGTISAFGSSMAVPSGTVTFNTWPTAALQTVSVSGTGTVTFSGGTPLALASITLSGGTLGGTDSFSVSSSFNWSGGTLTAPSTTPTLTINSGAALDISGAVAKFFTLRRIDNSGTTTWSGTGAVNAGGGATFNNLAGGTFEIGGDASWLYNQGGAIPVVNNSGTLRKTAGPGVTTFGSIFNQSSSTPVEVSSGALALNNGGNHSGGFTIGSGAILRFGGGTHTLAATSGLSGAGAAEFTGGSVTVSGNYALSTNPVFSAASVVFNGTISAFGSSMAVPSGTVTFNTSPTAALQTVSVSGTGTVTFSGGTPLALASITLSGGTLGGTDSFSVSSSFNWSGGTLTAPSTTPTLTINSGAALDISGAVAKFFTLRRIDNSGTAVWSGVGAVNAGLGATFNNLAGATFDIQGDASWPYNQGGALPVFNNSGRVIKSAGALTTSIAAEFNNNGSPAPGVDVQSGMLVLSGGGIHNGAFAISAGAKLRFGGGTHTLSATSSLSGAGTADFNVGTITINGEYALSADPLVLNATVAFNGPITAFGSTLSLPSTPGSVTFNTPPPSTLQTISTNGTINFSSGAALTFTSITLSAGRITGTDNIAVNGSFNWSAGTLAGASTLTINSGATFSMFTAGSKDFNGRIIDNFGSASWNDGGIISSGNGATLNNQAGATFLIQGNATWFYNMGGAIPVFNNSGTVTKSIGAGTTTIHAQFNNSSSTAPGVDIQTGILSLNGGGTHSGTFGIAPGATLRFGSGTHTLNATSALTGGGIADFDAGTVNISGEYALAASPIFSGAAVTFSGPITAFGSTLTVPSGSAVFNTSPTPALQAVSGSGGTINFSGGTPLALDTIALSSGTLTGTDNLSVATSFNWSGGIFSGASTLTVSSGATLTMSGTGKSLNGRSITNYGSGSWIGGTISSGNGATFNNEVGAILDIQTDAAWFHNLGGLAPRFNNNGSIFKNVTTASQSFAPLLTNAGTIGLNSGLLNPVGGYSQTPGGALAVSIGGLTVGTQYARLAVSGTATLDGTLNVALVNGFSPNIGDSFQIVTFTSRSGDFSTKNGLDIGSGKRFQYVLGASDVTLVTESIAAPTISGLSRLSGPAAGRTAVTITGSGFQSGATASFGGVAAYEVTFNSSASLSVVAPAHAAGNVDVVVTNPDGQSGSFSSYTYFVPSSASLYANQVLNAGPVAFYRLNDAGPSALDLSGNDRHGTYNGVMLGSAGVTSDGDAAATFDGTSSYVQLPGTWGATSWRELTIEAWVNVAGTTGDFQAIVSSNDIWQFAHMQLHDFGTISIYADTGAVEVPTVSGSPLNVWRHVVVTAKSGQSQLYVDGSPSGSANGALFSFINPSLDVMIGAGDLNGRFFNGRIDEVAIYDRALSASEVNAHYAAAGVPPAITEVRPGGGSISGGQNVDIYGSNLDTVTSVTFGGIPGSIFQQQPSFLRVTVPQRAAAGSVLLEVTNSIGTASATYFYEANHEVGRDFPISSNPGGPWSFGWSASRGAAFNLFGALSGGPGYDQWGFGPDSVSVYRNNGTAPLNLFSWSLPAGKTACHPGPSGENCVVRWTAPATSEYEISGAFTGIDYSGPTTTDVAVLVAGTEVFSANINSYASPQPFRVERALNAGDVVDFTVGFGNGNYFSDETMVDALITPISASVCTAPPAGITSWYRAEADASDSAGSNHGTNNGAAFVSGRVGQAFGFDGASSFVSVPDSPSLRPTELTIEGWIRYSALTPAVHAYFGKAIGNGSGATGFNSFVVWRDSAGNLSAHVSDGTTNGAILSHPWSPTAGVWYHLAYTLDPAGNQALYLDGQLIESGFAGVIPGYDANPFTIGADFEAGSPTYFFPGDVDEATLYGRALAAGEVQAIFNARSSGKCFNPAPAIASVVPDSGDVSGGYTVTISGTNLSGASSVTFGGTAATITGNTSTSISVIAPARSAGVVDVVATVASGSAVAPGGFTYTCGSQPAPIINASGPTSFCAGGSVTLTASAGDSYKWSNGATTQSIVVADAGSYSVTVTASGCSATSTPVIVSVTPAPTATSVTSAPNPSNSGQSVTLTANVAGTGCTPTGFVGSATIDGQMGSEWDAAKKTRIVVPIASGQTVPGTFLFMTDSTNLYVALRIDATGLTTPGSFTVQLEPPSGCAGIDSLVYNFSSGFFDGFRYADCSPGTDTADGGTSDGAVASSDNGSFSFHEMSHPLNSSDDLHDVSVGAGDTLRYRAQTRFCSGGCFDSAPIFSSLVVGSTASPSGTVTFDDGGIALGTAPVSGGQAMLSVASLSAGAHNLTATYSGDASFSTSGSATHGHNVCPAAPTVITAPAAMCENTGASASVSPAAGSTYSWSISNGTITAGNGTNAITFTVDVAGTATLDVTVTDSSGCTSTGSHSITVNATPVVSIASGGPTTFCSGGSVMLTANAAGGSGTYSSFEWYRDNAIVSGETSSAFVATTAGSYHAIVIDSAGCRSDQSPPIAITVDTPPPATISAPSSVCANSSATASVTPTANATYTWSVTNGTIDGPADTPSISFTAGATGLVTLNVTVTAGSCTSNGSADVNIGSFTPTIAADGPTTFCQGGSVVLTATQGSTYLWSDGSTTQSITVATSGDYTVTVTDASGCTGTSAAVTVTVNTPPDVTISAPASVCAGTDGHTASVPATAGASYTWSITGGTITGGQGTNTVTFAASTDSTGVMVSLMGTANGCSSSGAQNVAVSPTPPATIIAPAAVCADSTSNVASVTATAGATYSWSISGGTITGGDGTSAITFSAGTAPITLGVTVTAGSCSATGSAAVSVGTTLTPTIASSGPTTFCPGGSVTLTASTGASYLWSNGATTQSIVVSTAGDYSVTVTDAGGCSGTSASTTVAVQPAPAKPIITASGPATFCEGGSVVLTASSASSYQWSNGPTTESITVSAAGTFTVTITDANGCPATSDPFVTTLNPLPTATISGPAATCDGESVTLTASGNFSSITWSTGATTSAISVTPQATTTYTATVTGNGGCTRSVSHTVTVSEAGAPLSISAPASVTAFSSSNTATVMGAGEAFTWSIFNGSITGGQGSPTITFTAGESGSVTLNVTSDGNCASNGTISIPISLCATAAASLGSPEVGASVTSPATFSWSAVTGAIGYDVWRVTGGEAPAFVGSTIAPTTTLTASLPAGTFAWYVTARLPQSCSPSLLTSESRTITVEPAINCPTAAPTLVSPAAGSAVFSPVTFDWIAVENAIGYRVMGSFSGLPAVEIGTTDPTTTTLVATLPPGLISWWVEADYEGCAPVSSPVVTFQSEFEDCSKHEKAALLSPASGTTAASSEVTFSWNRVEGADGYAVWVIVDGEPQIFANTVGALTATAVLPSGLREWYLETLFEGCPSTESDHRFVLVTAATNCSAARPELSTPADGSIHSSPQVTFSWSGLANALRYELWLSVAGGTPSLVESTLSTTTTREVPAGEIDWFVRARINGCPAVDSLTRQFAYQPPAACNTTAPMLLLPLDDGRGITSPAEFRWTAVPGASEYRLWIERESRAPELVATTKVPEAFHVPASNGGNRWFVEAVFGQNCSTTRSSVGRFLIVPAPQSCSELGAPVMSVPGQVSASQGYVVQWSSVPGGESYVLTESQSGAAPTSVSVTGQTREFTHNNDSSQAQTYFYQVRAVDNDCSPPQHGALSPALAVTVLPARSTEASSLAGAHATVQHVIQIGPEHAGRSFISTPARDWITVQPSSGTVPARGLDLIVTADVTQLPLGTSIAGVTITFGEAGGSSRLTTQSNHTVTTSVSVNLVTPVTSTPKSSPPPDALIIPAVAHATGINAHFQSDVRVSNTSPQVMKYQVTFVPSGETGMSQGRQTTLDIEPGRTIALDDVLRSWFGTGGSNVLGMLEIRPLTQASSSTSSAAVRGVPNFVTFASSRTFNLTPNGTFGTYIAATPFANFVGKSSGTGRPPVLSLQQIAQSSAYRTNLGLVEGSGNPVELLVSVFDNKGARLTSFPVNLTGGQHLQMGGFLQAQGIEQLDDGRMEVQVLSGTGKVSAYAAVVNNQTGDSLVVSPVTLGSQNTSSKYVLPGVAELSSGVPWQTDIRLFNAGTESVTATLTLQPLISDTPQQTTIELAPGEVRQLDRALATLFGVSDDGGALHITTESNSSVVATARTYRPSGEGGNFGQFIQAVTPDQAIALGSRPLQILQVEESPRFRSNLGLAEVTGKPVRVEVTIIPPDSKVSGRVEIELAANQFRQLNSLLAAVGLRDTHNARVTVRVISGAGRVTAYAATIDALTHDPTFIPAQ